MKNLRTIIMKRKALLIVTFLFLILFPAKSNNLCFLKAFEIKNDTAPGVLNEADLLCNIDASILGRTYGYLKGQKITLDRIRMEIPELETQVNLCEMEFNLSFKNASERIYSDLKILLGKEFDLHEIEMNERLKSMNSNIELTTEIAIDFIEEVKQRAKGRIESPVLETLLSYEYIYSPSKEFSDGYKESFSTENHVKSQGVNMNLKLPISWDRKEGDRPHIVQKFFSENGKGNEGVILQIQDIEEFNEYDINSFYSVNYLRQMVPANGEFIAAKKIVIDSLPAGQVIFKLKQEQLDFTLSSEFIIYVMVIEKKLVYLYCSVYEENTDALDEHFNSFLPLFNMMANSIVIMNQY